MQESSYQQLVDRLAECEDLANNARDPSVKQKASQLAQGYRDLLAHAQRFAVSNRSAFEAMAMHNAIVGRLRDPGRFIKPLKP